MSISGRENPDPKCLCDFCVRIYPMHEQIKTALRTKKLREDFEYLMMRLMTAETDRDVAAMKLTGNWPGWEWLANARREQEGKHPIRL